MNKIIMNKIIMNKIIMNKIELNNNNIKYKLYGIYFSNS